MNRRIAHLALAVAVALALRVVVAPAAATAQTGESIQTVESIQSVQSVPTYTPRQDAATVKAARAKAAAAAAAAPRIAERYGLAPLAELGDATVAAPARLEALRAWNDAGRVPAHNGFERRLPVARSVELTAGLVAVNPVVEHAGGLAVEPALDKLAWGGMVRVTNAWRLRLHLSQVSLPAGARLWVHGGGHTAGPFGVELVDDRGELWTPSVPGEEAAVDVEVPAASLAGKARYGFTIDKVMEIVDLSGGAPAGVAGAKANTSCNLDARCFTSNDFPAIESARHAVALIYFVDSGEGGQCTAELLTDSINSGTPFMLTANHCISTPAGARTLQAFWDYYTPTCNGTAPLLENLQESAGSSLLATGAAPASDYTLLRLNNIPAGRSFLGWTADPNATASGTLLYRLSNPMNLPQNFVVTRSDPSTPTCDGVPRPSFLYSDQVQGGSFGGSSGSAAMLANGQVVSQLYGGCGSPNDCSPAQFTVDGAFAQSFPALQQFLQPNGAGGACRPDDFSLCLLQRRFRVQVNWSNQFNGASGSGLAISSTDSTGFFYFTDPSNYELVVKILDFGNVVKVFYTELTNLHFTITVADTVFGTVKTYKNTAGDCGAIDDNAFPSSSGTGAAAKRGQTPAVPAVPEAPAAAAVAKRGSCAPASNTLCLLNRRFAVSVHWMNQFNNTSGQGNPRNLSDESGLFTFTDATVLELVLKMVGFPDRTAFFYGALSNLEYDLTVTDTVGGTTKTYHNPAGNYCGGLDNTAFPP
jgi:lysyl endopeptidase